MLVAKTKTGNLVFIGTHKIDGHGRPCKIYQCADCDARYPMVGRKIQCNGQTIKKCPWCEEK